MIDPGALYAGALAVYGEAEMARAYGTLQGVSAARVDASADGQTIHLGGRPLLLIDTPGHARHHHCIWDQATRGWFTGDTFGLSYREFDTAKGPWIVPTATPVQFEPGVLEASIRRMLAFDPQCMYLTHFGRVTDVERLGALLLDLLAQLTAMAQAERASAGRHQVLRQRQLELFGASLAAHGCTLDASAVAALLAMDIELNAQGLAIWLDRAA